MMRRLGLYLGSGRNVTGDNYYTSLQTVNRMLAYNVTYAGTILHDKQCLPDQAKMTTNCIPEQGHEPCECPVYNIRWATKFNENQILYFLQ